MFFLLLNEYKVFGKCCYESINYCHCIPSFALIKFLLNTSLHYVVDLYMWIKLNLLEMGTFSISPSGNCSLVQFKVDLTYASPRRLLISCIACSRAYFVNKTT